MKSIMFALAGVAAIAATAVAHADDKVTLQLKWVTQAQFAGYYVAKDKGFYKAEGLDVTIKPGGPDIAPEQVLAGGGADVVVDWMPAALAAREKGAPMVNIAQPFKHSGLELTCRADTGIKKPEDLKGRTLGVWFYGNEYPFLNWMSKLHFKTDGSPGGVKVVKQGFNVDPLLQKQADCISTMTYNEYWQVIDAGYKPDQLVVFKYEDQGVATLEDGLYVMEDKLKDPAFVDKMARFVKASMKGWDYARAHPEEAVKIVLDNDFDRRPDRAPSDADAERDQQAHPRLRRQARQGRLRAHGEDAFDRRLRPRDLEGANRRLYDSGHRQGARQVSAGGALNRRRPAARCGGRPTRLVRNGVLETVRPPINLTPGAKIRPEGASSPAKRKRSHRDVRPYRSQAMRVKLFSLGVTTPIQSLENDINDFLELQRPHVTHVSVSSSDVERVASVWYEEPHHRTVEQTMAELEELVEEPSGEGNLA